jgi:hypothetical protein
MSSFINYLFPTIGIFRSFPRALVDAPLEYFGLGVPHLYTIQELTRIQTTSTSFTCRLYREALILKVGMGTSVLDTHHSLTSFTLQLTP